MERDCAAQGISFIPVVAETSGGWGASAMCTFKALAKAAASRELDDAESAVKPRLQRHLEHECTAIRRANARAVLRRAPDAGAYGDEAARSALSFLDA